MSTVKYLDQSINIIEQFKRITKCKVALDLNNDIFFDGELEFNTEFLKLTLFASLDERFDYLGNRSLKIVISSNEYIIKNFYFNDTSGTYVRGSQQKFYQKYSGNIYELKSFKDEADNNLFRRVIIPVFENLNFDFYVEASVYDIKHSINDEQSGWSRNLVPVEVNEDYLDFYFYYDFEKKLNYVVVDSLQSLTGKSFEKYLNSIFLSYSFISGFYPNGERFYFSSENKDFNELRLSAFIKYDSLIKKHYSTIHSNSYAFRNLIGMESAEIYKSKLYEINQNLFSHIVTTIHVNKELQRAIYLFQKASSEELFVQASLYSIVLETISSIIKNEKNQFNPKFDVESKKIIRTLKNALQGAIDNNEDEFYKLNKEIQKRIEKRIENLAQPLNSELLLKPFKTLGIELNEDEIEVINYRNEFLHGRDPLKEKYKDTTFNEMLYLCLRFFVILSKVILKYLGYNGRIINYPKIYEKITNIKLNEEPFVKI